MDISLRTKILLSISVIVFLVFGTSTVISISDLKHEFIQAIEWRSDALALGIINDIQLIQKYKTYYLTHTDELLAELSKQCSQLYEVYKDEDITHFAVMNKDGNIAAHNDEAMIDTSFAFPELMAHLGSSEKTTVLAGGVYHTLIPVFGIQDAYIGTIDIGVPENVVNARVRQVIFRALGLFGLFLALTFLSVSFLMRILLTRPITQLATMGQQLAEGQLVHTEQSTTLRDEIAVLKTVFNNISGYFQNTATIASRVATGVLASDIRLRSEHDVLGNAVRDMLRYLQEVAIVATQIEEGDLTRAVKIRSSEDAFGRVLHSMTEGLRSLIIQIRASAQQIASTGTEISSFTIRNTDIVQNVRQSAEKTRTVMNEIGRSVEDIARRMDMLSSSTDESFASVKQVSASIEQIASNTSQLTQQFHHAVSSLNSAFDSLEVVVQHTDVSQQLSRETHQDALKGQQVVEQVMNGIETLQQTMATAVDAITQFSTRSQDIDTILEVIRDIADQTSLLALNASIIAAQAGEHGRGFHIVAEEIKNLATGVMTSARDIAAIVHALQQDTRNVAQTVHQGAAHVEQSLTQTQQARSTLHNIAESARRSSSVVTEITGALHDVMTTSREVSAAMEKVNAMTDEITIATSKQQVSMEQIHETVESLNNMASEIRKTSVRQTAGVHEVSRATENVTSLIEQNMKSSQQLSTVAEKLALQAESLLKSVDRFRVHAAGDENIMRHS